jgi:hypothetical protein
MSAIIIISIPALSGLAIFWVDYISSKNNIFILHYSNYFCF